MSYDHTDFVRNPGKYRLYSTAVIARHIFTENGDDDLAPGTIVRVKFDRVARNQLHKRDEPVYRVEAQGEFQGYFYANVLTNFVL